MSISTNYSKAKILKKEIYFHTIFKHNFILYLYFKKMKVKFFWME
jgi:hypothetical protein